jgi:hypothetical protein
MKKLLGIILVLGLLTSSAHAAIPSCVPAYIYKTSGAGWVTLLLLPPVLALNVLGRVGDLPDTGKHLHSLTCTTLAMIGHVYVWNKKRVRLPTAEAYTSGPAVEPSYTGNWTNAGRV